MPKLVKGDADYSPLRRLVVDAIDKVLGSGRVTMAEFSRASRVAPNLIRAYRSGDREMTLQTADRLFVAAVRLLAVPLPVS